MKRARRRGARCPDRRYDFRHLRSHAYYRELQAERCAVSTWPALTKNAPPAGHLEQTAPRRATFRPSSPGRRRRRSTPPATT